MSSYSCRFDLFGTTLNNQDHSDTFSYFVPDISIDLPDFTLQTPDVSQSSLDVTSEIDKMERDLEDICNANNNKQEELANDEKKVELEETLDPERFKQQLRTKYQQLRELVPKPKERSISEAFALLFGAEKAKFKQIFVPKEAKLANFAADLVKRLQIKNKASGRQRGPGSDRDAITKVKDALGKAGWKRDQTSHPLYYIFTLDVDGQN